MVLGSGLLAPEAVVAGLGEVCAGCRPIGQLTGHWDRATLACLENLQENVIFKLTLSGLSVRNSELFFHGDCQQLATKHIYIV